MTKKLGRNPFDKKRTEKPKARRTEAKICKRMTLARKVAHLALIRIPAISYVVGCEAASLAKQVFSQKASLSI